MPVLLIAIVLLLTFVLSPIVLWVSARILRMQNVTFKRAYGVYLLLIGLNVVLLAAALLPLLASIWPVILLGLLQIAVAILLVRRFFRTTTWRAIGCWLLYAVLGVGTALSFRALAIEAFSIPTGSMAPTVLQGDRIVVDKITFRFREPRKGEIIVFRPPHDSTAKFLQRVVAIAGDRVEVRNDVVYVNDVASGRCVRNACEYNDMPPVKFPLTVPPGKLFMLGDNRDYSFDSRVWGFADVQLVVGLAGIVYASAEPPLDRYEAAKLQKEGKNPKEFNQQRIRWERIGTILR